MERTCGSFGVRRDPTGSGPQTRVDGKEGVVGSNPTEGFGRQVAADGLRSGTSMRRLVPFLLVASILGAGCGAQGSSRRPRRTITVSAGTHTYEPGGRVRPGDVVECAKGGGGGVGPPGTGVGSSSGFHAETSGGGTVTVTCPREIASL